MRIVSWNLWWRFGPWEDRQAGIAAELRRLDPDVVLLQEVWSDDDVDQAARLAAGLGHHLVRTTRPNGDPQRFGNAILSRWPIRSSTMVRLPGEDGAPSHRSVLAATVEAPHGLQPVITTHLAWQYGASALRSRQLTEVVALVDRHRSSLADSEAPPVILGGDLNAVPESDEIRRLTGLAPPYRDGLVFTDCWAAVGDGPGYTWTRDNPHAADALWPRRRLDYVLVTWPRPKPLCNPIAAALAGTDALPVGDGDPRSVVPSDHYAVVVDLDDRQTLDHG
ncbi:MAG: endonuclease/exonuclease/phosphatase family protein [Actinomycetota bacterium]